MSTPPKHKETRLKIDVNLLVPGFYVDLIDVHWKKHPFVFTSFKIKSEEEVVVIQNMGIKQVTIIPELSDVDISASGTQKKTVNSEKVYEEFLTQKNNRLDEAQIFRDRRAASAKNYLKISDIVQEMAHNLKAKPADAVETANKIVESLAEDFKDKMDLMTIMVNLGSGEHTHYNHSINVTILSMKLGAAEDLDQDQLHTLGLGALLHDAGKFELPNQLLMKKDKLSKSEVLLIQRHTTLGSLLLARTQQFPKKVLDIIEHHHEFLDGSGYPDKFTGEKLGKLTRIVAVANIYDNLCNPADIEKAITPKSALAVMYAKYRNKLDSHLIERFILIMGIYPPGTVVQLSDDSIGVVVTADPEFLLYPEILLYNPDIPKGEAMIIDLKKTESELTIKDALRPSQYPLCIYEYLGIKERLGYFIEKKST